MDDSKRLPEFEKTSEVDSRKREVRILINVLVPDPEYQPIFISDSASVFEVSGEIEERIREKLEFYLGQSLRFPLNQPLWKLVDHLKETIPGWPDESKN
jgi:hypothetical protein